MNGAADPSFPTGTGRIYRVGPPTVEQAKAALLAEEPPGPSPAAGAALDWARRNPLTVVIGAGVTGVLIAKSRVLRRVVMVGLLGPAVRREAMKVAADLIRIVLF